MTLLIRTQVSPPSVFSIILIFLSIPNLRMVSYLQNVVFLSLFIIQSEACLPTPPPSPPAPTLTPTPAPTTTKPKECPMDEKSCVGEDNVVAFKKQDMIGPDVCSKKTI